MVSTTATYITNPITALPRVQNPPLSKGTWFHPRPRRPSALPKTIATSQVPSFRMSRVTLRRDSRSLTVAGKPATMLVRERNR
jgi:hypothetical protein